MAHQVVGFFVKTEGEQRAGKQKASGNVLPANDVDRPNCESTDGSMAAMVAKLDVIMERLDKLDVLDQLAAQVASLTISLEYKQRSWPSLEYCHASIAELKAENDSLRTQVTEITPNTDDGKKRATTTRW